MADYPKKVRIIAEPKAIISLRKNKKFAESHTVQRIFRNCAEIIIIMDEDKFNEQWSNLESPLRRFFDAYDMVKPRVMPDMKMVYEHPEWSVVLDPFSVWLINKPQEDVDNFDQLLGMMAINPEMISDKMFCLEHEGKYYRNDIIEGDGNGWENFIDQIDRALPPRNAVVINDRYLFNNIDSNSGAFYGVDNLFILLEAILPLHLKTEFHIIILTSHPNAEAEKIDDAINELRTRIQDLREFPIKVQVAYGNAIHERMVYSNYFSINADRGFNIFKGHDPKKLAGENTLRIKTYLNNPFSSGSTGFEIAMGDLERIGQECENAYYHPSENDTDKTKNVRVDLNSEEKFNNRLLKI